MSEQKVRVYELAKELNKTSQELVEILNELGVSVKSYLSTIEEDTAILVKDICSTGKEAPAKPKIPPASVKASPSKTTPSKTPPAPKTTTSPKPSTPKAASSPKEPPSKPTATPTPTPPLAPTPPPKTPPSAPPTKATKAPDSKETESLTTPDHHYNLIKLSRKCQTTPSEMEIKLLKYGFVLNSSTMPIPNFIALSIMEMYDVDIDQNLSPDLDETLYIARAPVITIMGHVDHGKTTLLDTIRSTRVADKELGGITQALGAYSIQVQDKKIIFIDTPGHEAFTAMRASGSEVTDIVILVVAADDGVKEQTIEAINHAKAARVPIIVAINKIDREGANPDVVKSRLSEFSLTPEEWGGDTIMVPISAKNNTGIDELLELILLKAEMMDLRTNAKATFAGTVIESSITKSFGAEAAIIVQTGTLSLGDRITDGIQEYKIRVMYDDRDKKIKTQKALAPIKLQGLSDILRPGAILKKADKDLFSASSLLRPTEASIAENPTDLESLFQNETDNKFYSVIVKADGEGTLSATDVALSKIKVEGVELRIVHRGVGIITDNDVLLASVSQARIVGFNVTATTGARKEALDRKVELSNYRIIFDMIDDIKKGMEGTLEPEKVEQILGTVEVKASFKIPKGTIAGCIVRSGVVQKGAQVRIIRNRNILLETSISSLKRFKEDVKEVREGYECGIGLDNFNDIKIGDMLEVFHIIEKK